MLASKLNRSSITKVGYAYSTLLKPYHHIIPHYTAFVQGQGILSINDDNDESLSTSTIQPPGPPKHYRRTAVCEARHATLDNNDAVSASTIQPSSSEALSAYRRLRGKASTNLDDPSLPFPIA